MGSQEIQWGRRERLLRDVVESLESRGAANIHGEVPGTGSLLGRIFLQFGVGSE